MARCSLLRRMLSSCFILLAPLATSAQSAPTVSSISPGYGPVGTSVTINGSNFGATEGSSTLQFGSFTATPTSWSGTQIVAPVPSGMSNGKVYVTAVISSLSPNYGPPGTVVTVSGTHFGASQGASVLKFGTYAATPTSWSDTQIVAPVASNMPNGKVYPDVVVGGLDTYSAPPFTVGTPPIISGVSPAYGLPGTVVTFTGSNFGATRGSSTFSFGSTAATPTSWSDTQIVAPVPNMANGKVYPNAIVGGLNTISAPPFTVATPPTISSLSPTSGPVGTVVTITGTLFGSTQGSSAVAFNGASATPSSWSNTSIVAAVPAGAMTGNVVVTANGVSSNGVSFTVSAVSITSITPASAPVGAPVTITGSGFGAVQDVSTVSFNSQVPFTRSWSGTKIVAVVSNGTTSGPVSVTVGGVTSNTLNFTVTAPSNITSVAPNSGPAGTQVSITGSGFGNVQGSGTVQLGSRSGTVSSWSDTQIVATVAVGATSGNAQVRQSGVSSNSVGFTVVTAAITGIFPASAAAGSQVTITGSGFGSAQGTGQVWLGSAPAQVGSWSDTQVVAIVATGSNSGTAHVLQNGVWSNSVAFTVTGGAPHITSINPNTGSGGTVVTIRGTGFGSSKGSGIAWIGATQASVNSWSDTQVSVTVGTSAVSGVVKIQQNGLWSNALTFTVPFTSGTGGQVTLNPNVISMLVGDARSIQALGSNSQPVTGLTWMSSDTTIVTLSTDDPPFITAAAPGNATITAGGASADVTVYAGPALPVGTVIWSNPATGSAAGFFPAVPSRTGVADVFAVPFNGGNAQAIRSDGIAAWTTSVPPSNFFNANFFFSDFQGGLDVWSGTSIYRLDGLTGQSYPAYNATSTESQSIGFGEPAIHTDGTIFTIDYACAPDACGPSTSDTTDGAWVVGVDPSTGTPKFRVPTENWTTQVSADAFCSAFGGGTVNEHSFPANPMAIAGDGFAYTSYVSKDSVEQRKQAATEPFPVAAYTYFDALQVDTENGNFGAALNDLGALEGATGLTFDGLRQDLENGDQFHAINYIASITRSFRRLCDSSKTVVTKLHILRVGSDGSSADTIVNQWKDTVTTVYAPTLGDAYNYTQVTAGPGASVIDTQYWLPTVVAPAAILTLQPTTI
ncbi:MAG: hypothetical protein DMG36_25435 [Acidobacteria bacterium]|nr:MAG: hypothetical protein DMG36_25435 [Acidobacteriota bacterium]